MGEATTPNGDPIETRTIWLDYPDGEQGAISLDLTRFNAAMRRLKEQIEQRRRGGSR